MKNKPTIILFLIFAFVCLGIGQTGERILVADGSEVLMGNAAYLPQTDAVYSWIKKTTVRSKTFGEDQKCARSETDPENLSLISDAEGFFANQNQPVTAYLYTGCDSATNKKYSGLLLLSRLPDTKPTFVAHYLFAFGGELLIRKIKDLNGDGIDELAVFSELGRKKNVRLLEFGAQGLRSLTEEIYNLEKTPAAYSRIYAEKTAGGSPKLFQESYRMTGSGWVKNTLTATEFDADPTKFYRGGHSLGSRIVKSAVFILFILQMVVFLVFSCFLLYQIAKFLFLDSEEKEARKQEKIKRKSGQAPLIEGDDLPILEPIKCKNCASPVPLSEGELVCPSCGTVTAAPPDYFDVAKARQAIYEKLRQAEKSFRRANLYVSSLLRWTMGSIPVLLSGMLIAIFVWLSQDVFAPYQTYLIGDDTFTPLMGIGTFSSIFWIVSLGFGFFGWSPALRKALPTIESTENMGKSETAHCANCGGGISYLADDLATICGYCGGETYRARLAWKLKNVTNSINEKASFSLIESQKAVEDAKWGLVGTPIVFGCLLVIIVVLLTIALTVSSIYNALPQPVREILDLIFQLLEVVVMILDMIGSILEAFA